MDRTAELKLSKHVILIDVSFLNQTVGMVREVMSARLGRPLPKFDLVAWLDCLLLDAGMPDFSSTEVQVWLSHGTEVDTLDACMPSCLADLDGKACTTSLAEYVFYSIGTENFATSDGLYIDLVTLLCNTDGVRNVLLVPSASLDSFRLNEVVEQNRKADAEERGLQVVWFSLEPPAFLRACSWNPVVPSLAHVLGIRSEELQ